MLGNSLVTRMLATSVLVAAFATTATTWLAVQSTTRAIRQEQTRSLAGDKSVYDTLLGFAATHRDWTGVERPVAELAARLGRRIILSAEDRQIIADSHPGQPLPGARASATVDPLRVDLGLTGGTERIDPRVTGPYRPTAGELAELRRRAADQVRCLDSFGVPARVGVGPDGRPAAAGPGVLSLALQCPPPDLTTIQVSMRTPLRELTALTARCLGRAGRRELLLGPDFSVQLLDGDKVTAAGPAEVRRARVCVESARQQQLRPYVPPPTLLFVTEPGQDAAQPVFGLSRAGAVRTAAVSAAVLIVAILATVLVGRRLVRPLQALTEAARRPIDEQSRAPVTTRDEVGQLAAALNDLAERRERAERQRKAMVADVAHELRTPLTNIRSWLEAAQDGLAPADPELFDLLLEEALLLQHIVDDLRDLAAADAGTLRVHTENARIGDLLAQVAESHRSAAEAAGVGLRCEVPDGLEATVDPVRLRQMAGILVSNAVRHTPPGGTVVVSAAGRDGLVIAVRDTGSGISATDLPRVFDRFWRADTSRARETGGSGLGLAIARSLTEAHGGEITVTSELGAGTTVTISLPSRTS
ncbi:HAMP domain-containing sensor histidine kinase [Actinoplanes sp. NBRC 103695]|uniref:sensor histidine kinase n=1 Tax=Actinoplanes sp. NBRC 103695 TaxID=3032202 RepID=UPI0024A4838A|nr:HAMP domain-containing sensor histidine kinase [Actinoplanes sp. NBRC 103695]GLY93842.1 two-component sensor histidine kinase [Actinoplanes sp. NBRC 103695]